MSMTQWLIGLFRRHRPLPGAIPGQDPVMASRPDNTGYLDKRTDPRDPFGFGRIQGERKVEYDKSDAR